jgi:hypothetical protein
MMEMVICIKIINNIILIFANLIKIYRKKVVKINDMKSYNVYIIY